MKIVSENVEIRIIDKEEIPAKTKRETGLFKRLIRKVRKVEKVKNEN